MNTDGNNMPAEDDKMKMSVFGLGYVGCVSAACFADEGHTVIGVDKNNTKIEIINSGRSPVVESEIDEIIQRNVTAKRLSATGDSEAAVEGSDLSLVCVGTPSNSNGSMNFTYLERVCNEIGDALKHKDTYHVVVLRSTILPGVPHDIAIPVIECASGKRIGLDIGFCVNPEFLREGSSVSDFRNPPKTVIGQYDERSGDLVEKLYRHLDAPIFRTDMDTASMIKYADNSFHALKVAFANEIGRVCKRCKVDSRIVMEILSKDTKLNISPIYLKPGFAFGGSCLPKDLRAITYRARELDVEVPLLKAIMASNTRHIEEALREIRKCGKKKVGFLGMSFKAGTDDLRESPLVTAIEYLIGKGHSVSIFDRNVSIARLMGSNKEYIDREIPHIARLMRKSAEDVIAESEIVVIGNNSSEHKRALQKFNNGHKIIDLVGLYDKNDEVNGNYEGLCW